MAESWWELANDYTILFSKSKESDCVKNDDCLFHTNRKFDKEIGPDYG